MTPRKSYSRYFIILQEEQKGYGMDADKAPSGYAKLEVKNNRSKISYYVQNLKKDRGPYYMILITDKQNPRSLINLGKLNIDDNGRADVNFDYDMNSIGNTNIAMDKIVGAAVVYMNGKITPIMIGFSTTDVPKDWTTYPISKGTTQPTTGTGTTTKPSTGTTTGTGTGATGTGTGTTGGMGTGGTGASTGTGTTTKPSTGTTTGTGTGATGTGTGTTGGMGTGGVGAGTGTGTTTKPSTGTTTGTGTGATGTGTGTTGGMGTGGVGAGTGTGTTTKPSTGTTTGTGTGATGTGTGTTGAGGTGVGTGAGTTGAGTTGGMGSGSVGTGTTGAGGMGTGAGATGTTGTGTTGGGMGTGGVGTGTTGAGTGTGTMGTQPSAGTTTNDFVDEFEDYYEDVNIINMTPTTEGSTPTRNRDIFDLYEEEIENSKLDRHKHKKCKHHEEDDCQCKHHEEDDYHCKHHKKHHQDEDECPEYLMHHMYDEDDYKNDNNCSPCMDNKKYDVKYNNYENNKHEMCKDDMHKYNWPLGNTGEFFKNIVKGFEKLGENENIKNCLWYKVSVNKLEDMYCIYDYNKYTVVFYPMICYYPYISKKKSFMIGYKCDDEGNLKYIIYGIAGTKALEDQPYGGKTGFVTWMPSKNEKDMGHWLMYYDFKTNNVVIPIKR